LARRKARSTRLLAGAGLVLLLGAGLGWWAFTRGGLAWRGPARTGGLIPALAARGAAGTGAAPGSPQRNVILVSIDTLRADHLGCYGYGPPTTPEIDRFALGAIVFENAIAQAPSTLPSHASIFTSMLPSHHGAMYSTKTALAPEALTLAEVLKTNGFAAAGFHGGGQVGAEFGLGQGFDPYVRVAGPFAATVAAALTWLDQAPGRPFFLFLHTYEVHHPYTPDPAILEIFDQGYSGNLPDHIELDEHLGRINGTASPRLEIDAADLKHIVATYDAEIRSMDAAFGTLVEGLEERGLADDTLIVLTSDHGEEFGEHGFVGWHSHSLYDELLRVPLVIRPPGGEAGGGRVTDLVRGLDVAPTILAVLGLPQPPSFDGEPVLDGSPLPLVAVSQMDRKYDPPISALRTPEWKLYEDRLFWRVYRDRLFDLRADPAERHDVLADHLETARALAAQLRAIESRRHRADGEVAGLSPEAVRQLRSLGYAE
jgi:arylsulfatase A-like enzyme